MVKLGVCRPQKHPITTHLFPYSNIVDTVRLPLISGKKTHSWGKIAGSCGKTYYLTQKIPVIVVYCPKCTNQHVECKYETQEGNQTPV
jgi:hypothetical protein